MVCVCVAAVRAVCQAICFVSNDTNLQGNEVDLGERDRCSASHDETPVLSTAAYLDPLKPAAYVSKAD